MYPLKDTTPFNYFPQNICQNGPNEFDTLWPLWSTKYIKGHLGFNTLYLFQKNIILQTSLVKPCLEVGFSYSGAQRVYKSLTSGSIWGVVSHLNIAKISKHPSEYFSNCDNISKILFSNQSFQQTLNKIEFYIPFNENFSLCHLFVSGPYVLVSSYNGIIKNAFYLFIYFVILLLVLFNRRLFELSIWFEIVIIFSIYSTSG